MKKVIKIMAASLVCIFSLITSAACGCSKSAEIKYTVTLSNKNQADAPIDVNMTGKQFIKYREPENAECYTADGTLIENASGISECYDKNQNKFEKATHLNTDKKKMDENFAILTTGDLFES